MVRCSNLCGDPRPVPGEHPGICACGGYLTDDPVGRRLLECGCSFVGEGDDWKPCIKHSGSSLHRVRKAHGELLA